MTNRIKIVFLLSNPKNISRIRLDEELREVSERIRMAKLRDRFELIPLLAVRPRDVTQALLEYKPHILHFAGHGSPTQGIVLEDNNGQTKLVSADALAHLFGVIKDNLRVVLLNACYSGLQVGGISQVIDFTIGMQKTIGDKSAIVFASSFYEALAYGRNVNEAFGLGVTNLMMEGIPEADVPVLVQREGADATTVHLAAPAARKQPPPHKKPGTKNSTKRDQVSQNGIGNFHKSRVKAETLIMGHEVNTK
jgi:hypothetical protein